MRRGLAVLLALIAAPVLAQNSTVRFLGFLSSRAISVESQPSWLSGGVGRFDAGADAAGDRAFKHLESAHLGVDWTPRQWLSVRVEGIVRNEPDDRDASSAGLLQAYVDVSGEKWTLRAGSFWLPTSRENIDPMWHSRYALTYSALNTWIGQEVRPIGVDVQYSPNFYITLGATAFGGNDTMGTALAGRGWTLGSRLSTFGETLPLPVAGTTTPFWQDLDGDVGYSGRIRLQLPERGLIQVTHLDNRAQLVPLLKNHEPWQTRFDLVSGSIGAAGPHTIAAEWMRGWTAVGFPGGSFTMDFDTAYLLYSHKRGANRWTVRAEQFSTASHVKRNPDFAAEDGHAVTVAWLRDLSPRLRFGAEYLRASGDRPGVEGLGFSRDTAGAAFTVELRYALHD